MAHYWGKFVRSVVNGSQAEEWEHFRNAENPAQTLKSRARKQYSRVHYPGSKVPGQLTPIEAFNGADMSAMYLMWLSRDIPEPDKAPDEVWHLTNHGGLIRSTWSSIIDPVGIDSDPDDEDEFVREPTLDDHDEGEMSVISWDDHGIQDIWRPPSSQEVADRKVYLIGDQRPLTAGAYSERAVERPNLRRACPDCKVVPSPFTLECKC